VILAAVCTNQHGLDVPVTNVLFFFFIDRGILDQQGFVVELDQL